MQNITKYKQFAATSNFQSKRHYRCKVACVAGGMRERASGGRAAIFLSGEAREEFASGEAASGGRAAIFLSGEAREEFASGEAASEFPACHISYGFCLPPTFIASDESIK